MTNLMDLYAKITLDDREFNKGIDGAANAVGALGGKIKSGLETAAKIGVAALTAAATGIGVLVKQSVDSYAEYEQLVGGVETLFGDSASKIQEYANNAYQTAGMSANDYMSTVTSFSASLLQSLGGDTTKAAEYAQMAVTDMSDNANKMGVDVERIQVAYQGFAKQNYSMLDNLQMGYGGTKEEMQRLVSDAAKVDSAVKANDLSFSNVVLAIHTMQEQMGIAGTTAKEAATTISGSANMMKAAWENLLVGFSNGNANLSTLIAQFVESVKVYAGNIMPVITQALQGVSMLIQQIAPIIASELPAMINSTLPALLSAATTLISGLMSALPSMLQTLIQVGAQVVPQIGAAIVATLPQLLAVGMQMIATLAQGLVSNAPQMIQGVRTLIQNLVSTFQANLPALIQVGAQIIVNLINGLRNALPQIAQVGLNIIQTIANGISNGIPRLLQMAPQIFTQFISGLSSGISQLTTIGVNMINSLAAGLKEGIPNFLSQALPMITQFSANLRQNAGKLVDAGLNLIMNIAQGISKAIPDLVKNIPTIVSNIAGIINDNAPKLLQTGIQIIGALIKGIIQAIPTIVANIPKIIKAIVDVFTAFNWLNLGKQIIEFLGKGITSMVKFAGDAAKTIFNAIVNFIKNLPQNLLNIGKNAIYMLSNGISGMVDAVAYAARVIVTTVIKFIGSLPGKVLDIGKNIVKGLWEGIKSAAGWLWDKIAGFASNIIDKVKGFFGIHSPSTVFAGIGENMAKGIGVGWDNEYKSIRNDIEKSLRFNPASIGVNGYGVSSIGTIDTASDSNESESDTVTEYNMQVTINLNGSDYTSQRQIAEEISVQLQNLVNRRSAAWA